MPLSGHAKNKEQGKRRAASERMPPLFIVSIQG